MCVCMCVLLEHYVLLIEYECMHVCHVYAYIYIYIYIYIYVGV